MPQRACQLDFQAFSSIFRLILLTDTSLTLSSAFRQRCHADIAELRHGQMIFAAAD